MAAVTVTLVTAGSDTGPYFDLYTDADCFTNPIHSDVGISDFFGAGFIATNVPDNATVMRVASKGTCINYIDIIIT